LLWTGPRRIVSLFFFNVLLARRVGRHRLSSVMHPPQPVDEIPEWLVVPELAALPPADQAAIGQKALQSANAKHPQGMNLPSLLLGTVLFGITIYFIGAKWLHGARFCVGLAVAAVEFIPSLYFGWWWWRVAYSRHFKKVIRQEIAARAGA
jgi:hypothetical protein